MRPNKLKYIKVLLLVAAVYQYTSGLIKLILTLINKISEPDPNTSSDKAWISPYMCQVQVKTKWALFNPSLKMSWVWTSHVHVSSFSCLNMDFGSFSCWTKMRGFLPKWTQGKLRLFWAIFYSRNPWYLPSDYKP